MTTPAFDPFDRRCPSRTVLDAVADRWALLVLAALADGPLRFGEVRERVDGVSQKMLTQTLRELARDGLVDRTQAPHGPPRVEYALTPLGRTAATPASDLVAWARTHADAVLGHRAKEGPDLGLTAPRTARPR